MRLPMELIGVALSTEPERVREMAYVFAEEFARLGFDERRLLRLFKNPFYAGPHRAYRLLGEPAVREIVGECVRVWGRGRLTAEPGTSPWTSPRTSEGA